MLNELLGVIGDLKGIIGNKWVVTEKDAVEGYLRDETIDVVCPEPTHDVIVAKPCNAEEVSKILKIANKETIPVYPVGGKTGLVGGSVPIKPGIVVSLERFKNIEIDKDNLMVVAEAGVTLEDLLKTSEDAGLSFPLHPGDEGAFVGGLIATNAGGVRAVKYGIMRNYVKGIEIVLPTGEILNLGGKLLKNNVGYDLMHLIIGSEGTLGIITKAVLRLHPKTKHSITLIAPFNNRHDAIATAPKILQSAITPLAIEYVEKEDMTKSAEHLNEKWQVEEGFCQLIIILVDNNEDILYEQCEQIEAICKENNSGELVIADRREEQSKILRIRSNLYTALKRDMCDILDSAVPPSKLAELMDTVDKIGEKYNTRLPVYGHAGDGNLHIHIMKVNGKVPDYFEQVKRQVYEATVKLGGTITGEHGIGWTKIKELGWVLSKKKIEIMREIKRIFDPNNILNQGKAIPSDS